MKLQNHQPTLETISNKMLEARLAVAKGELNPIAVAPDQVMPFTDRLQEGLDYYGPNFRWTPQTTVDVAVADLEVARRAKRIEGGVRFLAAVPGVMLAGEGSRLLSGAEFLSNTPIKEFSPWIGVAQVGVIAAIGYFCLYKGQKAFQAAACDQNMSKSLELVAGNRR
ncbi:hypothetical protein IV102_32455 [bacterium]|nr:hypothetical protein [bacterium]